MNTPTQDEIKLYEEENNYWSELANALEELEKNTHFKKLILEGYFKDFAVNQTSMLATDYVRKSGSRPEIMERLVAISNLQDWFATIKQLTASFTEEQDEE
jgi:hypothetical protein